LAAKSFDFSPSSIRDRWAAGGRDAVRGLGLLAPDGRGNGRFKYLTLPDSLGPPKGAASQAASALA
jgi:NTE family protein